MTLAVVLLAAGHGTRMDSKVQKVLHEVGGKPMIVHVFEAAEQVADIRPVVVVGAGEHGVQQLLENRAEYVVQKERLGTGHATLVARDALSGRADQVLVTYGDMPLLRAETMSRLADTQAQSSAAVVMLSAMGEPDSPFGRVVRDGHGHVAEIVEVAEAKLRADTDALLAIRELNAGVYCFDGPWLWENLPHLPVREARSGPEYYLTDMVGVAVAQGRPVEAVVAADPDECLGAGTRAEMVVVECAFRNRANRRWLEAGVTLLDPATTYIDQDVAIGRDTVVWPNTYLQGETTVGEDCILGPNTILRDAQLGDGCRVEQTVVEGEELEAGTVLEPFTYVRKENQPPRERGAQTDLD